LAAVFVAAPANSDSASATKISPFCSGVMIEVLPSFLSTMMLEIRASEDGCHVSASTSAWTSSLAPSLCYS
jgi:hypothetical protein